MKRILIVDDKAENRLILGRFLQLGGYEGLFAANGAEALAAAINDPPDMVISDVLMPVMDGFTLCREWRKNKILQKLPFIFYTGTYTDPKDEEFALKLGADRYIVRPQEMNDFLKMIKEEIEKNNYTEDRIMPSSPPEEKILLKEYNEALVRKLEDKMTQVEAIEKELREKIAELEKDIEARKQAEEKLRQSEEQFRLISENVDDMIAILDLDGKRIYNNPSYEPILGSVELLKGTDSFQEIHPDDQEKIRKIFQETVKTGKGQRGEYRFIKQDGSISFIESQGNVIRDEIGNIVSVVVVSRDITNRRKGEETLRESEEKYRSVCENSQIAILLTRPNGTILSANEYTCRLFGKTEEEICSASRDALIDVTDSRLPKFLEERKRTGKARGELTFIRKDGTTFEGEVTSAVFRDREGKKKASMIIQDLTERKQAEKARREAEQKFRTIFDMVSDGILLAGVDDRKFSIANSTICRMLGYTEEELLRLRLPDIHPEESLPYVIDQFEKIYRKEIVIAHDIPVLKKDRQVLLTDISGSLITMGGKEFLLGAFRDLTKRKQMEKALRVSEERYRTLAEAAHDMIFIVNRDDIVEYVNSSAAGLYHQKPEELVGRSRASLFPLEVSSGRQLSLQTLFETGMHRYIESKLILLDELKWMGTWLVPLRNENGQVNAVMGVSRDITNRKWLEEDKEKLLNRLQQALSQVKTLSGLLPICASCKKIRDDSGYWQQVESYIQSHTDATFTHGVCPECVSKLYPDYNPVAPQRR